MKLKYVSICLLLAVLILIFSSIASAEVRIGKVSHEIETEYGIGNNIKGWINISLKDEPAKSLFETSEGDSITLIELLELSPDYDYNCTPVDCESAYSGSNGETTKTFSLEPGKSKIIGLKLAGSISEISSIKFNVTSDALPSCTNQLKIDFFNDNKTDFKNNKSLGSASSICANKQYGCFIPGSENGEFDIITNENDYRYCQRMRLPESAGFKLGAWVKKISGSKNLKMSLYSEEEEEIDTECTLPEASGTGGEIFCELNYTTSKRADYYVCIHSSSGDGQYQIRGEGDPAIKCGFYGDPAEYAEDETAAYQIFAIGKGFDAFGKMEINNAFQDGSSLNEIISDYIFTKYNGDCSAGCIIPINFSSGKTQTINISNLALRYEKRGVGLITSNQFYDIVESNVKVSSKFQKLQLDKANFSVPSSIGDEDFELSLDGERIFLEEISVEKVSKIDYLSPTMTSAAIPTEFRVNVSAQGTNVTQYDWAFGDGENTTTAVNKITHTYNEIGTYELKVTVTHSNLLTTSRIFSIIVGSPKDAVNATLKRKLDDLSRAKAQIKSLTSVYQTALENAINFTASEDKITELQRAYIEAASDDDYITIMNDLMELKIPKSIIVSKSAVSISFYSRGENIDLATLKEISGSSVNYSQNEDEYINAILDWDNKNLNVKMDYKEFSSVLEHSSEPILNVFEFAITKKQDFEGDIYFLIPKSESLKFIGSYSEQEKNDFMYLKIPSSGKIVFSTSENVEFKDIPAVVSPSLTKLSVSRPTAQAEKSSWTKPIIIIFLILAIGLVVYLILQEWYKRKYETYLFKDRNKLFNLLTYINNSKNKGMSEGEIINNLKKVGWNSEQIKYAMKKYSGRRTGMMEIIPLDKIKLGKGQ